MCFFVQEAVLISSFIYPDVWVSVFEHLINKFRLIYIYDETDDR